MTTQREQESVSIWHPLRHRLFRALWIATHRGALPASETVDTTPSRHWPAPDLDDEPEPEEGPVLVTVEYHIDPDQVEAFFLAISDLGRTRRRDGALRWGLFGDRVEPGRYLESFVIESWADYLRQRDRFTVADQEVEQEVCAFHSDDSPPVTSHFIAQRYLA